jgi:hypothetical protein
MLPQSPGRDAAFTPTSESVQLNRLAGSHALRTAQALLQLQRHLGNRHVQRLLARAQDANHDTEVAPDVEEAIRHTQGSGQALDSAVRLQMESAFGTDFSGVRVHNDSQADGLNQTLSARAFTTGQDIFFGEGEYNPGSSHGRELLAHELTHVVQQRPGGPRRKLTTSQPGDVYEQEADAVARAVVGRERWSTSQQSDARLIQQQIAEEEEEQVQAKRAAGHVHSAATVKTLNPAAPAPLSRHTPHFVGQKGRAAIQKADAVEQAKIPPGGTNINKIGIVYKEDGANLRAEPDPGKNPIDLLPFNMKVYIIKSFPGDWYYVSTLDSGKTGYIDAKRIWTHLPEPNSKLYKIQSSEDALTIARKFYSGSIEKGRDARYYVNVLVYVNKGEGDTSRGIYKENKNDTWDKTKTRANYLIWIPEADFANALVGTVQSGTFFSDTLEGIKQAFTGFIQGLQDIMDAAILSAQYIPGAIAKRVEEALKEVLVSLALFLVGAVAILAVTTGIGAAIGALAGGAGAAPGAAVGFKVGMVILEYLGLAMLIYWIGSKVVEIGGAFWKFLKTAWRADGDRKVIDRAAQDFADAIGLLIAFILQALVFYVANIGMTRGMRALANTRLGKWIGTTRLGEWLGRQLSRKKPAETVPEGEARTVPESVKGLKFGRPEEGYAPDRIFMDWIKEPIPSEGWKIHVSASAESSPRVADIVLPLLRSMKVNHKVVNSPEALAGMGGTQTGKFVTIYPRDAAHARGIVKALDGALTGQGVKGPAISGEKPVGSSGLTYTRYGGFTKSTVTDPSGKEVPDVRGQIKPDWIKDPWAGEGGGGPLVAPVPGAGSPNED